MASVNKREWTYKGEKKSAWIVRYFDHKEERKQRTFNKKKDADRFKLQVENERVQGGPVVAGNVETLADLCELYMRAQDDRQRDGRIGRSRREQIRFAVDCAIIPLLGHKKVQDLSPADVEGFYARLCRERGMKPRTALGRVGELSLVMQFAMRRGLVRTNVVPEGRRELRGIPPHRIRTLSIAETRALIAAAEVRGFRCQERTFQLLRCYVHLAVFCGLRWGEITALTLDSIDLEGQALRVRANMTRFDELKGPKTAAGNRDVPLPTHIVGMLEHWLASQHFRNDRGLVFCQADGTMIKQGDFWVNWKRLLERAGIANEENADGVHFHALRHFAASWWIANGFALTDAAAMMGHAKVDMTMQVYAHAMLVGQRRTEAFDRAATLLLSGPVAHGATPSLAQDSHIGR